MRYLYLLSCMFIFIVLSSCKDLNLSFFSAAQNENSRSLKEKQDSLRIADSIQIVQTELLELENVKLDSVRKEEAKKKVQNSSFRYKIIVGSFTSSQNARDLAEAYKARGFVIEIIKVPETAIEYVSVESHETRSSAMERLKEIRLTVDPGAWLYTAERP